MTSTHPSRTNLSGNVEWAVLIFLGGIAGGCLWIAWSARGVLAGYERKYDAAIAALQRAIEDRNFLMKYDLSIADMTKDIRHAKNNIEQHGVIFNELHDDFLRVRFEVDRLTKLVNGKH